MIIATELPDFEAGIYCIYGKNWLDTVRAMNRVWDQLIKPSDPSSPPFDNRAELILLDQLNLRMGVLVGDRLHYAEIERIMERMYAEPNHRWVISTMHPWVLDRLVFTSAEDAQRRLFQATPEGHLLKMTDKEATHFWRSWEAGIQHVSEILITSGLW